MKRENPEKTEQMEHQENVAREGLKVHRAMQEHRVLLGHLAHQVLQAAKETEVTQDLLDQEETKEGTANEVMLVHLDHLGPLGHVEQEVAVGKLEHPVSLVTLDLLVHVGLLVLQGHLVTMEQMEQVVLLALQDQWVIKANRVLLEMLVSQDQKEILDHLDLPDHLEQ